MANIAGPVDHETGDLSQYSLVEGGPTASTDAAYAGTYGLEAALNEGSDSPAEREARLTFSPPASGVVALTLWFRWFSFGQAGYGTVISRCVALLGPAGVDDSTERAAWLAVVGTRQLRLAIRRADGTQDFAGSAITLDAGTWYQITLIVDRSGAQPVASWRLDGVEQASATDTTSGGNGLGRDIALAKVGVAHVAQWERGVYTVHVDDVVVADTADSGGENVTQDVSGAISPAGAAARAPRRSILGALPPSGVTSRLIAPHRTGATTPTGQASRGAGRAAAGGLPSSGVALRAAGRAVAGAATAAGGLLRQLSRGLIGGIDGSGLAGRKAGRPAVGALAPAGSRLRQLGRALAAGISLSGLAEWASTGLRQLSLDGGLALLGAAQRWTARPVGGDSAGTGEVERKPGRPVAGEVAAGGELGRALQVRRAGVLGLAGGLGRWARRLLAGALAAAGVAVQRVAGTTGTGTATMTLAVTGAAEMTLAAEGSATMTISTTGELS